MKIFFTDVDTSLHEVIRKSFLDDYYQVKVDYTNLSDTSTASNISNDNIKENRKNIIHNANKVPNNKFDKVIW